MRVPQLSLFYTSHASHISSARRIENINDVRAHLADRAFCWFASYTSVLVRRAWDALTSPTWIHRIDTHRINNGHATQCRDATNRRPQCSHGRHASHTLPNQKHVEFYSLAELSRDEARSGFREHAQRIGLLKRAVVARRGFAGARKDDQTAHGWIKAIACVRARPLVMILACRRGVIASAAMATLEKHPAMYNIYPCTAPVTITQQQR